MADKRFFQKKGPFTLRELARVADAQLAPGVDPDFVIEDVAPLDTASSSNISFLDNIKYRDRFRETRAGACIVPPKFSDDAPPGIHLLLSSSPYKAYALIAQAYYPPQAREEGIAHSAEIHPSARIGLGCRIESGVVIGKDAVIGNRTLIEAHALIGAGVSVGNECWIGPGATVSHAMIGDHVRLYPGVRIGQDGFGFAIDPAGHVKVPQLGRVIIGDHVEIGANTTIDRGSGPDTVIGQGTWIDNLVQVGHNVKIGKGCVIAAQVGISGSTVIEDFVMLGGQAGVAGHLHIGAGARIAAQSGVMRDIPAGQEQMGYPAVPLRSFMKQAALLNRLIRKTKED
ncbi:MAG: UDP-3-O-(3-hydroxymyristoyl)glucosamine N-acyltransferase [Alphaproteobacteria bacterium]|nr:UDP-3-O-(3-hydroxymyristoyl)glucosamine N-acyltransferase [Alphaproteobacteria bacterium]